MKKKVVVVFFLLFLLNISLEYSINCSSIPESQDDIRDWTLFNNENNIRVIEVEESRNVSINYYIEEIEENDQMRYIVSLNFTGDTLQLYGNVSEDRVQNFTIFYLTIFAGDEANMYYELQILNETIFTIPNYFYHFSWNFTSAEPLQFLNLRFHRSAWFTGNNSITGGNGFVSLINDSPVFEKDSFKNLKGKINFNINSQQFITNFNISVDFSRENHTEINFANNEINYGDGSVAHTEFYGALSYMNREQSIIDNGWIYVIHTTYSQINYVQIPVTEVFGLNYPTSSSIISNDEIINQTDRLILSMEIVPFLKVDSPMYIYDYVQNWLLVYLSFELDNISPSTEFFQKTSKIFIASGIFLGISVLVTLRIVYKRKKKYS